MINGFQCLALALGGDAFQAAEAYANHIAQTGVVRGKQHVRFTTVMSMRDFGPRRDRPGESSPLADEYSR